MSNFITNTGSTTLRKRLIALIKESWELKFLVGFFYFSGIAELYEGLKNNPDLSMKILVGLNAGPHIHELVEYAHKDGKTKVERVEDYHDSVLQAINTDSFDNEEFYEQVGYFLEQIINDRIIIRKTRNPNHAKLYLFKLKEDQVVRRELFITGSSNLSRAGLRDREEFNVEISDYGIQEAEIYFDELWDSAIEITEIEAEKARLIENIREKTLLKSVHPFDAYMFVVKTWLDSFQKFASDRYISSMLEAKGYKPYKYQIDAVTQALSIIEDFGGVILADVVGLGKSIIASLIARKLEKRGMIICPPGLIGDDSASSGWKKYKKDFKLYDWEVRSGGDLDGITEYLANTDSIEVIIVDEAHRYRNSKTETYEKLKNICRGKIVILLTATPFNNSPADILSMLSLFIVPKKSNITLSDNLVDLFRFYDNLFKTLASIRKDHDSKDPKKREKAQKTYEALFGEKEIDLKKVLGRASQLSKQIRDVIEPVTIRRNRLDLINDPDYSEEVKLLSEIANPQEWYFQLSKEQSEFYDKVIEKYFTDDADSEHRFKGPIYKPYRYEGDDSDEKKMTRQEQIDRLSQDNLYNLMRRQLVKRFESSFGAFRQSVVNMQDIYERIKEFIRASGGRYVLNRKLINNVDIDDPDQIDEVLRQFAEEYKDEDSKKYRIYELDKFELKKEFYDDIESDIALFKKMIEEIDALELVENDPKRFALLENVEEILQTAPQKGEPKAKVVIFSEYADTIGYLEPYLKKKFSDRVLVISGGTGRKLLEDVNKNFDAAYKKAHQKNDFDILISTDKLSEGFNLNRACMVVNYDIPWNPVRVIQRVGRINRISKKVFNTLYITNFFPTEKGADIVKSREIASHKMFMIHQTLGEDARIFDAEEEPTAAKLFEKVQTNPYDLDKESPYTKMKKLMLQWKKEQPERLKQLKDMPLRIKTAKHFSNDSMVMFIRKGKLFSVSPDFTDESNQLIPLPIDEALQRIECKPETKKLSLSANFWNDYNFLKEEAMKFSIMESQNSNATKAYNFISSLLEQDIPELGDHKGFLIMLREDMRDYGTLPEYTLKSIADWHNNGKPDYQNIARELNILKTALGSNYLKKVKDSLKTHESQVIVAVENQKWQ